jgi:hypothetical protein
VSDLEDLRRLARAASASLEASRAHIDDLNVYPVPDGDTGTNMALTVRAVVEALDELEDGDRRALAHGVTRAALMGARGNSGVILSQIVRGAAEVLTEERDVDVPALARALRGASDAAYRGVRRPVEGTMLTVIREMAEEAEARTASESWVTELLRSVLARGEDALRRTEEMLDVLRDAGVVDAGGAGLVELVRGLVAAVAGEQLPEPPRRDRLPLEAMHQELSRYRYCTAFVVEGAGLDRDGLESALEPLGDSLLVVGDALALKAHVHTDDPGAALSAAVRLGALAGVEIADMHAQTLERERRLSGPEQPERVSRTDIVAVVAGEGNRRLYKSLGVAEIVEGGQSMNPSTEQILAAIDRTAAPEAIVLPNNPNVIMSAEQAAALAGKEVRVVPSRSMQAGLSAVEACDPSKPAEENAAAMRAALDSVATGAVTTASRDVELNGARIRKGQYVGLLEGEPILGGESFDEVAEAVAGELLAREPGLLTLLTGADAPDIDRLVALVEERHPDVEVHRHAGGQPHYHLLLSAE